MSRNTVASLVGNSALASAGLTAGRHGVAMSAIETAKSLAEQHAPHLNGLASEAAASWREHVGIGLPPGAAAGALPVGELTRDAYLDSLGGRGAGADLSTATARSLIEHSRAAAGIIPTVDTARSLAERYAMGGPSFASQAEGSWHEQTETGSLSDSMREALRLAGVGKTSCIDPTVFLGAGAGISVLGTHAEEHLRSIRAGESAQIERWQAAGIPIDPLANVRESLFPSVATMQQMTGFPEIYGSGGASNLDASKSRVAEWERMAGIRKPSLVDDLVAKAREVMHPVASTYQEAIAAAQSHAKLFADQQIELARSWLGNQGDPVALLQRSTREIAEASGLYAGILTQLGWDRSDTAGAMGTMKMMLEGVGVTNRFNGGLVSQSFAAAALVEASRYDPAAAAALRGRSFLLDAFAEVDRYVAIDADDTAFEELEEGEIAEDAADLMARILVLFHQYMGKAKTAYEQVSLAQVLNVLSLVVAVASYQATLESSATGDKTAAELKGEITRQGEVQTKLLEGILGELRANRKAPEQATYYVVLRMSPLKEVQSMKSATLATLHPNQVVRLLERDGKWIEVEYFDYLAGETRSGWVVKKYLKMVER